MTPDEFADFMNRLGELFDPATRAMGEIYFEHFKAIDREAMRKASLILEKNHPYRRFPLISEIREALQAAQVMTTIDAAEEAASNPQSCEICCGMGWMPIKVVDRATGREREAVTFCDCPVGQRRKEAARDESRRAVERKKAGNAALRYSEKYLGPDGKMAAAGPLDEWDEGDKKA